MPNHVAKEYYYWLYALFSVPAIFIVVHSVIFGYIQVYYKINKLSHQISHFLIDLSDVAYTF